MSKVLFILMPNYRDEEFTVPYEMLVGEGHDVDVAGLQEGHKLLLPELTTQDFDQYDALVIPGGPGSTTYLWNNEEIQEIIKYFHEGHKLIAAICHAVIAVVQSGILLNKHATVYPTDKAKEIFEEYGVRFSKDGCVALAPEKIITAQGPKQAEDFGHAILNGLK